MGDATYFGQDVDRITGILDERSQLMETPRAEGESLWRKYCETKRAAVKLAVSLRGYFLENGILKEERETYGKYLQMRIRPAVEYLICHDEIRQLEKIAMDGWIKPEQIDSYMQMAKEHERVTALIWLMQWKEKQGTFTDRDFTI